MLVKCSVAFEVTIILFLVTILSYQQSFWTTCNYYHVSYFLRQNECITCLWHYKRQGQTFHSNFMGDIVLLSSSVGQITAFPNYPHETKKIGSGILILSLLMEAGALFITFSDSFSCDTQFNCNMIKEVGGKLQGNT